MTKMTTMAINIKNLLFQNQNPHDSETRHETSGRGALLSLYKSRPWDDHDLSYGKVNRSPMHLNWGKLENVIKWGENLLGLCKLTEDLC